MGSWNSISRYARGALPALRPTGGTALALGIALTLLFGGCRKSTEIASQWATKPLMADGAVSDWSGMAATRLEVKQISVIIANDSANMYVLVRFRDPMWARMIRRSGLTLWLTPKGQDEDYFMLRYKGGPSAAELRKLGGERERPDWDSLSRDERPRMMPPLPDTASNQLVCEVKNRIVDKVIPTDGTQGPLAASGVSDGMVAYEFTIPLSESRVMHYGLGTEPGQGVEIKAVWGESDMERPQGEKPQFGMGGGGMPGGGPPGRGGMPGGGPPGGRGDRQMPQKQEYTIKTVLAQPLQVSEEK